MGRTRYAVALLACACVASALLAAESDPPPPGVRVNPSAISAGFRETVGEMLARSSESADDHRGPPDDAPVARTEGREDLGTPPELAFAFGGPIRGDIGSASFPANASGAAGPAHFVGLVNGNASIYDKATGARLASLTLASFFFPYAPAGAPRILFDQYSGRYFAIASSLSGGRALQLAVSAGDDAMGGWTKFEFAADGGADAGCWPDNPNLGVTADGIHLTAFMVPCGVSIFVIDKAPLLASPAALGTITAFRGLPYEGTLQPVHSFGAVSGGYFISRNSSTTLRLRRLDGPSTAPTLVNAGVVTVPAHLAPPDAPALGSTVPLETLDARLTGGVYRDGVIWTAHAIDVDGRAACRWYALAPAAPSPVLLQSGTVSDPVLSFCYPAIMVNAHGDAAMGFSGSHAGQYAAAYFTGRIAADPPGEMAPPQLYRAGLAPQNNLDGGGHNRWADHSQTSLDPSDGLRFWTIQSYAHATNIWGTAIGQLAYPDCNSNAVLDDRDIAAGTSPDCDQSGIPDECELAGADCDADGVLDACALAAGAVPDCNGNGAPDACDIAAGLTADCDANGVPDICDVAPGGTADDCNGDGIPDACQLAGADCNSNDRLDECDAADLGATIIGPDDVDACAADSVALTVDAPGATAYLWLRNGEALAEEWPYSQVTDSTLLIASGGEGGDGSVYACRVTFGCLAVQTRSAVLRVLPELVTVSLLSPTPLTLCADSGLAAVFAVAVDAPQGASFRWSHDGVELSDNGRISGAASASLQIASVTSGDAGEYRCRVWNACTSLDDVVSTAGVLALSNAEFLQSPQDRCAEPGDEISFHASVTASAPFVLRWYEGSAPLSDGARLWGTDSDTLVLHDAQLPDDGRQFRLRAIVPEALCSTYSPAASLSVRPPGECPACRYAPGDMDGDGDFDLADLQTFTACFGVNVMLDSACACANLDATNRIVNLADWRALQPLLTGPQ